MNSDELRTKIIHAIQAPGSFSDWAERAADRIIAEIASLNPPATAKLPEGQGWKLAGEEKPPIGKRVLVYGDNGNGWVDVWMGHYDGRWNGKCWMIEGGASDNVTHWKEVAAPPVPGAPFVDWDPHARHIAELAKAQARIAELEAEVNDFHHHLQQLCHAVSEQQFTVNSCGWADVGKPTEYAKGGARRHQYDLIEQRLKAAYDFMEPKPHPRAMPTPTAKPDARKVAPNGRAMVRYRTPTAGPRGEVWGQDDEGQWWQWGTDARWYPNRTPRTEPGESPCTFDGTPITETRPDPLARAVTVGEMLRLADETQLQGWPNLAQSIRTIFAPQGAAHAE